MSLGVVHVIGGGLSGVEVAYRCLKEGVGVNLYEMKPSRFSPAHRSSNLAELVCSNSLKSKLKNSASGLLKEEMNLLGSLMMEISSKCEVPAGNALAVDRVLFSKYVEERLAEFEGFHRIEQEVCSLEDISVGNDECIVICTGPLSSEGITKELQRLCDISDLSEDKSRDHLFFYDALSPIVEADSLDMDICYKGSRYEMDSSGENCGDYLNIPLNKEEYLSFVSDLLNADKVEARSFEESKFFEGCLPIEVMAERGVDTLRFGPLKPVGMIDPRTKRRPWANIQLRAENKEESIYNMVGFQTKMSYPAQREVFKKLPGMSQANFLRLGSIHRNTYINSPKVLREDLSFRKDPRIFLAGQLTGVEGYVESAATGVIAGISVCSRLKKMEFILPPEDTIIGELIRYVVGKSRKVDTKHFSPLNANMGLIGIDGIDFSSFDEEVKKLLSKKKLSKEEKNRIKCFIHDLKFKGYLDRLNK